MSAVVSRRQLLRGALRGEVDAHARSVPPAPPPPDVVPLRAFVPASDGTPVPLSAELEVDESPPPWATAS